jgi:hypothetical protein
MTSGPKRRRPLPDTRLDHFFRRAPKTDCSVCVVRAAGVWRIFSSSEAIILNSPLSACSAGLTHELAKQSACDGKPRAPEAVWWVDLASRGMNWASRLLRESMRTDGASILPPAAPMPDYLDKRRLLRPCRNFGETPKSTRETRVPLSSGALRPSPFALRPSPFALLTNHFQLRPFHGVNLKYH